MHTTCAENTCFHCHGVMGQRQLAIDTAGQDDQGCKAVFAVAPPPEVPFGKPFGLDLITQWPGTVHRSAQKYGALARDGISCTVCHHIAATDLGQELTYTGNFITGPANELYGSYENTTIVPRPMEHALGITPLLADQITSANLCGSCHNVLLPVFDNAGNLVKASYEQSTHLEWTNSDFAPGRANFRSCQDCHMPTQFKGQALAFQIANFDSSAFAPAVFANNPSPFIQELAELPGAERFDPYYTDPQLTGADQIEYVIPLDAETLARVDNVRVSLYNQSIPPFYLQERFRDANRGPGEKNDIQRLYHVTSHLDVNAVTDDQGQPVLQNWKLLIAVPQTRPLE